MAHTHTHSTLRHTKTYSYAHTPTHTHKCNTETRKHTQEQKRKQTFTQGHGCAHTFTHTNGDAQTHRQIQLLRTITNLWQPAKSKTGSVEGPGLERKRKKAQHIFHVCCVVLNIEERNLAAQTHITPKRFPGNEEE